MRNINMDSPFAIPNVRLFIAFKVLFNSRFYYPIFTILFLDFGLTVAQFSLLNAVWAATIVLAEVPSGALADITGRKSLLVFATTLMVFEISIISFVPTSNMTLVFTLFLINRILSGLAEAAASGADEAIAFDSLKAAGYPELWGRVLETSMRLQSLGFIIAMTIGAAVYDPAMMTRLFRWIGFNIHFTQEITMRFPLYLTLVLSIFVLGTTLKMTETHLNSASDNTAPSPEDDTLASFEHDTHRAEKPGNTEIKKVSAKYPTQNNHRKPSNENDQIDFVPVLTMGLYPKIQHAFALTFQAGRWILDTPFVLFVILFGMLFDGLIRMVITLNSQYYRLIEVPESVFGIIGAGVSTFGLIIPRIARWIAENKTPSHGLWVTSFLTLTGLWGMSRFWPYWGILPALVTFSAMYFTGFFVSFHVNQVTSSEQRATVLSFKGLLYNISYGLLGVFYALLLKIQQTHLMGPENGKHGSEISNAISALGNEKLSTEALENAVFMDSFGWFVWAFPVGLLILLAFYRFGKSIDNE